MIDIFLFDNFFFIAASIIILFFAIVAWQLALVRKYFVAIFLPVMVFTTYIIGKEVYDHFGMPTAALPTEKVIVLWHNYDSSTDTMYMLALNATKRDAIPKYYAFKWTDEKKEELRKAQEEKEKDGAVTIDFGNTEEVGDDVISSETVYQLMLKLPKKGEQNQ